MKCCVWLLCALVAFGAGGARAEEAAVGEVALVEIKPGDPDSADARALATLFVRAVGGAAVDTLFDIAPPSMKEPFPDALRSDLSDEASPVHRRLFSPEEGFFPELPGRLPEIKLYRLIAAEGGAWVEPDVLHACVCRTDDCAGRWPLTREDVLAMSRPTREVATRCIVLTREQGAWWAAY